MTDCNTVALTGTISVLEPLRHTPAGLPVINFTLTHKSTLVEAGYRRQVECEVNAVAMGEPAKRMSQLGNGAMLKVSGFLARRNRLSRQLMLHVTETELIKEADHA